MAGWAPWGTRKTIEEMQARAREMYGPFRDETRTDPTTGLSYQFSDIRPGEDRTDPVWLTPEQKEAGDAFFAKGYDTDSGRKRTLPAFTQNPDGSFSSGSQTISAPSSANVAWGYTGRPGIFTKAWGAATGQDFPDQVRAKTPWTEAYVNTIKPFSPWSGEDGWHVPHAISSLVTEPARLTEKAVSGQEYNPADRASLAMTLFAAGGIGKGLTSGKQSGILGRTGSKLGLEDENITPPEASVPSLVQNYRDAASPVFAAGDEKAAMLLANQQSPTLWQRLRGVRPGVQRFDRYGDFLNAQINPGELQKWIDGEHFRYRWHAGDGPFRADGQMMDPDTINYLRRVFNEETGANLPPVKSPYARIQEIGPERDGRILFHEGAWTHGRRNLRELQAEMLRDFPNLGGYYGTRVTGSRVRKAAQDGTLPYQFVDGLFSAGDERSAFALGALNDQRPFYGKDVGPRGRIADPVEERARLGLRAGLPGLPTEQGFFNPATAALLQEGVQPKQTVAYYRKQMGSRGGKLPPGMWERATDGLSDADTIARDDLVKRIDEMTPTLNIQRHYQNAEFDGGLEPRHQHWSTRGDFGNYQENVTGYQKYNRPITGPAPDYAPIGGKNAVGAFTDENHFPDHPNLEGWYRTQDANDILTRSDVVPPGAHFDPETGVYYTNKRLAEEVQPQRYQRLRDVGEGAPQEQLFQWSNERDRAHADIDLARKQIQKIKDDATALELDPDNPFSIQQIINNPNHPLSARLKQDQDRIWNLNRDIQLSKDRIRDLENKIVAGKKGVNPSPFTHDINAATDFQLKNLVRDAANEDVDRLLWTPGEVQAKRYNQALEDVRGIRYEPDGGRLYVKRAGDRQWMSVKSGVKPEELPDIVTKNVAAKLLATENKPSMPGASYGGHMLEFPNGMTIGGEGMKGFYGSGPMAEGGILPARIKALWKKVTGQEPSIAPHKIDTENLERGVKTYRRQAYPSVEMTPEMRKTIRRIGLPLYASGDEKAAAFMSMFDRDGQLSAFWGDEVGRKMPDDTDYSVPGRVLNDQGLYSVLDESLPKINRKQANAQAWLNELKKQGVKDSEIYWRGLDDFLKSKGANGQFTKDEIAEYLGNNKVQLFDHLHEQDGTTADAIREREIDNVYSSDFVYDRSPEDFGYKIEKWKPDEAEITKRVENDYEIRSGDQGDMFDPQGSNYAVWDKIEGELVDTADTMDEAREIAAEHAKKILLREAKDNGEGYVLYDTDGSEYNRYGDAEEASNRAMEMAQEAEADRIREMSDQEIWDDFGYDEKPGATAEHYMENERPSGGKDYSEHIVGLNKKTLERKGSGGWTSDTGRHADSIHPDSFYDNVLGWRLEEVYKDLLDPSQTGLLTHEAQSRWHARGTEKGWKKSTSKEELEKLQSAYQAAEDAWSKAENDYTTLWQPEQRTVKWKADAPNKQGLAYGANDITRLIRSALSRIKDAEGRREGWVSHRDDPDLSDVQREGATYQIQQLDDKLAREREIVAHAQERYKNEIEPYVDHYVADETANETAARSPEFAAYRQWAEQQNALHIAMNEAKSRITAAKGGAEPGPWVAGDKSDIMGLLLKTGLYRAAQEGHDFYGVQGAQRMQERWGSRGPYEDYGRIDPKTGKEAGVIPMTLQKLARMFKKDAKVEPLYPGNRAASRGYYASDNNMMPGSQPILPLQFGDQGGDAAGPLHLSTTRKVDGVVMHVKKDTGEPVYLLRVGGRNSGFGDNTSYAEYLTKGGAAGYTTHYRGDFNNALLTFKTREAAEDAMHQINTSKAKDYRERNQPEKLKEEFAKDDPVGEPFNAVRLDDEMREMIKARGFPMFAAGDERAALAAGAFDMSPEAQRARAKELGHMDTPFYHGTTHSINPRTGFEDPAQSPRYEKEGYHGAAIYHSTSRSDANDNYAGIGPDLTNRIHKEAERLVDDLGDLSPQKRQALKRMAQRLEDEGLDVPRYQGGRMAFALAYQKIVGSKGKRGDSVTHKHSLNPQNPVRLGAFEGKRETYFENQYFSPEQDEATGEWVVRDADGDEVGRYDDESEAHDHANDMTYNNTDSPLSKISNFIRVNSGGSYGQRAAADDLIGRIMEDGIDGIAASKLERMIRDSDFTTPLLDDYEGGVGQFMQDLYRKLGYDAVIMPDADKQFRGMNIAPGTVHVATFDPANVRDYDKAKYDPAKRHEKNWLAETGDPAAGAFLGQDEQPEETGSMGLLDRLKGLWGR